MKKSSIIFIISIILAIILLIVGFNIFNKKDEIVYIITNDSLNFQNDYNSLNENDEYINVNIPSYSPISYTTYEEIFNIFENKESKVVLFASPTCNLSRTFVEALMSYAVTNNVKDIKYIDITNDRNELTINKKGKIKEVKKASEDYLKLIDYLKEYLHPYDGLNDESILRLYLPTLVFIKDGKIVGFEESLPSYLNRIKENDTIPMNDEEIKELYEILNNDFNQK